MCNCKQARDFFTVEQAADTLQLHPTTVRAMIRRHELGAVKIGGAHWRIPAAAMSALGTPAGDLEADR